MLRNKKRRSLASVSKIPWLIQEMNSMDSPFSWRAIASFNYCGVWFWWFWWSWWLGPSSPWPIIPPLFIFDWQCSIIPCICPLISSICVIISSCCCCICSGVMGGTCPVGLCANKGPALTTKRVKPAAAVPRTVLVNKFAFISTSPGLNFFLLNSG